MTSSLALLLLLVASWPACWLPTHTGERETHPEEGDDSPILEDEEPATIPKVGPSVFRQRRSRGAEARKAVATPQLQRPYLPDTCSDEKMLQGERRGGRRRNISRTVWARLFCPWRAQVVGPQ